MAGWSRRRALGNGERVAYSTERAVRRQGNRFLGARVHSDHVSADFNPALVRDSENPAEDMGLSSFFRLRRVSSRHNLLHTSLEVRESDGSECRSEYSACYINCWGVSAFW